MITQRDRLVISFLENYKIAKTRTIYELFYPSLRVAQKRLKSLSENKIIKREQLYFNYDYIYFLKKPKQLKHSLLLTEFYREFNKIVDIKYFLVEHKIDFIKPDGIIGYEYKGNKYIAFLEIELSNKGFDIDKYISFYKTGYYTKYFPVFPIVIVITNKKISKQDKFKVIKIKEDLSDIKVNHNSKMSK